MGNRSFLYILRPRGEQREFEAIAEANNTLPSLWQVLLADGTAATAMECQRAFGETRTINICADAQRGMERYRSLCTFLRRAPRSAQVPGLLRYLDAADQFLTQQIERWTAPDKAAPVFCANFDELSWMDDSRPNVFIAHRLEEFAQTWSVLQKAMREDNFEDLEILLGFDNWGMRYDEWIAWSAVFGFSSLGHLYFSGSYKEARDTDYADFDPDDDASNGENYLGGGCSRFKQDGKWGVHRWDEYLAPTVVLAPEWDRVLHAGENEQELVWVQRDERIGLAAIAGDDAGRVLLAPCLDATWDFVDGLAIARRGDKMGYLRRDGQWFIEPAWDEAWRYANGYAVVATQGRHGYLNKEAKVAIAPRFDEADEFGEGIARVRLGSAYGLIHADGSFAVEPTYARLDWSNDCCGWLTEQAGRRGLLKVDGSPWLAAQWDAIECLAKDQLLLVRRAGRCGAVDWEGRLVLKCEYDDLRPRHAQALRSANAATFAGEPSGPAGIELIARRGRRVGLIDSTGRILAPFSFSRIESFEPHPYPPHQQFTRNELLRVHAAPSSEFDPEGMLKAGVWSVTQQRLIVPCDYDMVWLTKTTRTLHFNFVVAMANTRELARTRGPYSVGVLNADGTPLFEPEFAWIASDLDLEGPSALTEVRNLLCIEWSSGRPVEASLGRNVPSVWLHPNGRRDTHDERLAAKLRRQGY
jgi:hypothetical protein